MQENVFRLRLVNSSAVNLIPNRSAKICNNRITNQICDTQTGIQIFLTNQKWRMKLVSSSGQIWLFFSTKWNRLNNLSE